MPNMTLIQAVTVGAGGAQSITFNSIPSTYTDLVLKLSVRNTDGNYGGFSMRVNSNSTPFYGRWLSGIGGGTAESGFSNEFYFPYGGMTAGSFTNTEIYITNYLSSNNKSVSADDANESNTSTGYRFNNFFAYSLADTNPITSLNVAVGTGFADKFAQYSTAYLYGVASAAASAKATGGNLVVTDGTYWYHSFTSSGTFTPTSALTADVLLVAGGGGGGYDQYSGGRGAGGGGAGGLLALTSQSLSATAYTITVGAGGTSASLGSNGNGTNSTFQTLTAAVGGGGGGGNNTGGGSDDGGNGGSGGGAASAATVGTGVSGQGFAGGNNTGDNYAGGGGGGATEVGKQGPAAGGTGIGGAGSNAYSTWASITNTGSGGYYAGGGGGQNQSGGSDGGLGGGGHGATGGTSNSGVTAGTARTGGGGGGGRPGGTGGSGVIIVRYAV